MPLLGPRVVVAGTSSGVGKTTIATGLLAAFRAKATNAAPAKVGPDFIDPGYHALAAGRPSRNLDAWICGPDAIAPLAARAAEGADLLVIEGVMGLFDGSADGDVASTAEVAALLDAPVVLVVDASAMSGSVAAVVHGFATFDRRVRVAGVILNRVGSDRHAAMLREALEPVGVPVVGVVGRDGALTWRDRHLGLVPVVEHAGDVRRSLDRLAAVVLSSVDLAAIEAIARTAPAVQVPFRPPAAAPSAGAGAVRVAVAGGRAFSFTYPENLERLVEAGAEVVPFDPLHDPALPDGCAALYAGGGFPEVFAAELAANQLLLADVEARVRKGLVVWAECGGMLWLCRELDGHRLAGVVPAAGSMTTRLSLGYRTAQMRRASPIAPAGAVLRGHEFHYSAVDPPGDALELSGRFGGGPGGFATPSLLATYLHLHLGADAGPAERFVAAAAAAAGRAG